VAVPPFDHRQAEPLMKGSRLVGGILHRLLDGLLMQFGIGEISLIE
jgi:hypothetical protein